MSECCFLETDVCLHFCKLFFIVFALCLLNMVDLHNILQLPLLILVLHLAFSLSAFQASLAKRKITRQAMRNSMVS